MSNGYGDIPRMLTASEQAAPVDATNVVAHDLRERFDAVRVSFLIVDLSGKALVRLSTATGSAVEPAPVRTGLFDTVHGQVVRTQHPHQDRTDEGHRALLPVTNRGDAIGLLELILPTEPGPDVLHELRNAAHLLSYVVVANDRFTDFYAWGRRTAILTLAAEIQRQLLPPSQSCEASQFVISGNLEPSYHSSGDIFDYSVDRDILDLSIIDAMGHNLDSALVATVLMSALRGARRANSNLAAQAQQADQALSEYGHGHATGQLLRLSFQDGRAQLVNAGHPWPLRMRNGQVTEVPCEVDGPFGVGLPQLSPFRVQEISLRPGDRLVLLTDGMLERNAEGVDLPGVLENTQHLHPRDAALRMTTAVLDAAGGELQDDATVLCLDWHETTAVTSATK